MAPGFYGYSNVAVDFAAYVVLVLSIGCVSFAFAALALRFMTRPWVVTDSIAEHAYTIYLVHYIFVVWLQFLLLDAALPAIGKAALVFVGTLSLSWFVALLFGRVSAGMRLLRAKPLSAQKRPNGV